MQQASTQGGARIRPSRGQANGNGKPARSALPTAPLPCYAGPHRQPRPARPPARRAACAHACAPARPTSDMTRPTTRWFML